MQIHPPTVKAPAMESDSVSGGAYTDSETGAYHNPSQYHIFVIVDI